MKLQDIVDRLPLDSDRPRLVTGMTIEFNQEFNSDRSHPTIIILTDRQLLVKGGNGHDGIDGNDMENIRVAILGALGLPRGDGFVLSFIVRERRHYPAGTYNVI
ncbi:hypothetical protein LPN01_15535 [Sphingomonas sp. A2-49]|uniref:hypothetical protein n=1 Tax=Sphingomonas sp. A2-49 TaxID=1391375 RepID=UPI0021CF711E|nr:hypothetical protein [Sphingomonas sp. A2-49]MCU6455492.1 hypothetical protein [Sphingomonas sp. A2-49]